MKISNINKNYSKLRIKRKPYNFVFAKSRTEAANAAKDFADFKAMYLKSKEISNLIFKMASDSEHQFVQFDFGDSAVYAKAVNRGMFKKVPWNQHVLWAFEHPNSTESDGIASLLLHMNVHDPRILQTFKDLPYVTLLQPPHDREGSIDELEIDHNGRVIEVKVEAFNRRSLQVKIAEARQINVDAAIERDDLNRDMANFSQRAEHILTNFASMSRADLESKIDSLEQDMSKSNVGNNKYLFGTRVAALNPWLYQRINNLAIAKPTRDSGRTASLLPTDDYSELLAKYDESDLPHVRAYLRYFMLEVPVPGDVFQAMKLDQIGLGFPTFQIRNLDDSIKTRRTQALEVELMHDLKDDYLLHLRFYKHLIEKDWKNFSKDERIFILFKTGAIQLERKEFFNDLDKLRNFIGYKKPASIWDIFKSTKEVSERYSRPEDKELISSFLKVYEIYDFLELNKIEGDITSKTFQSTKKIETTELILIRFALNS